MPGYRDRTVLPVVPSSVRRRLRFRTPASASTSSCAWATSLSSAGSIEHSPSRQASECAAHRTPGAMGAHPSPSIAASQRQLPCRNSTFASSAHLGGSRDRRVDSQFEQGGPGMGERQTIDQLLANARARLNRLEPAAALRAQAEGATLIDPSVRTRSIPPAGSFRARFPSRCPCSSGASTPRPPITTPG